MTNINKNINKNDSHITKKLDPGPEKLSSSVSNCKKKYYFLSHCSKYLNLSHLFGDCFGLASLCLPLSLGPHFRHLV